MKRERGFTISGPSFGTKGGYETGAIALSAAITRAQRAPQNTTVYVRGENDEPFGHVSHEQDGTLLIHRTVA